MQNIVDAINNAAVRDLLKAGKAIGSTDYAVRQYNRKDTPFYHDQEKLKHALRRAAAMGNSSTRETILRSLGYDYDARIEKKKFAAWLSKKHCSKDDYIGFDLMKRDMLYEEFCSSRNRNRKEDAELPV